MAAGLPAAFRLPGGRGTLRRLSREGGGQRASRTRNGHPARAPAPRRQKGGQRPPNVASKIPCLWGAHRKEPAGGGLLLENVNPDFPHFLDTPLQGAIPTPILQRRKPRVGETQG